MARACFRAVSAGGVTLRPLLTVPAAAGRLPACFLTVFVGEQAVGSCHLELGEQPGSLYEGNIGYAIDEPHRRRGRGTAACRLLCSLAAVCGLNRVLAACDPLNTASRRCCERAGLRLIGVLPLPRGHALWRPDYQTVCVYQKSLTRRGKDR